VDEKQLIQQAGQGDEAAFEQLVRQHQKTVYNLCLRMTGDREESFDLAQETFLKAWHAISLFQFDCKFTTWLCRIASNTCIDHLRKQRRKKQISLTQLDDEDTPYERLIADDSQDPALLAERAEDHRQVQAVFARLPEQDRLILSLRAVEDMSYQEIGEALDLKPGTVKSRIARAREKVRRSLGGNFLSEFSSDKGKGGMRS
jgi:RNA polymerase sigma-70 factor (ECF subfamily)